MILLRPHRFSLSRALGVLFLAGALCGSVAAAGAQAQSDGEQAPEQLRRLSEDMRKAGQDSRYEAEQTVYEYLDDRIHVTRYRIQHAHPYLRKEVIGGPKGSKVVTLEDGKSLWSYFPEKGIVVKEAIDPSSSILPAQLPEDLDLLTRNYRVFLRGPVTVDDGLSCDVVEFVPRKGDRPSREFWLESGRKLPIRMYMDGPDGRPAYRTELKRIRWDPDFDDETFQIQVPRDTKVFEIQKRGHLSLDDARRLLDRRVSLPVFVPDGYVPSNIVLRVEALRKRLQVIYSDGLSSYSVFQEWTAAESPEASGAAQPASAPAAPAQTQEPPAAPAETQIGMAAPAQTQEPAAAPAAAPEPSSHRAYRYGLITVVTYDHGGHRTVAVGDINDGRLLQVVRSVNDEK